MSDPIKFVSPAFKATPTLNEGPDHYIIRNGRITAWSHGLAMSAPLPDVPDCCPRADLFRAAVDKGGDAIGYDLGANLVVRSKGLRVAVPCLAERPYEPLPHGDAYPIPEGFQGALRALSPFMSTDDARPWVKVIHTGGRCLSATNNISVVQMWTRHELPPISIPDFAVAALLREKQSPVSLQISATDITFHYEDSRWIKALFYEGAWPWDGVMRIMADHKGSVSEAVPEGLKAAVERIEPFCDKDMPRVFFRDDGIGTTHVPETGAHVACPGLPDQLAFGTRNLLNTLSIADHIMWSQDKRHSFTRDTNTRGMVMGVAW